MFKKDSTSGTGTGTIQDDDAAPVLTFDGSQSGDISAAEGASGTSTATLTVKLSAASEQTVTVNFATADGTAQSTGSSPDFQALSGTLTFAPGETSKTIDFTTSAGSLYRNTPLQTNTTVLLTGAIPDHTEPVAWTHDYQGARVFYTSLGHEKDFEDAAFRRLLVNAIHWTLNKPPPATVQ